VIRYTEGRVRGSSSRTRLRWDGLDRNAALDRNPSNPLGFRDDL